MYSTIYSILLYSAKKTLYLFNIYSILLYSAKKKAQIIQLFEYIIYIHHVCRRFDVRTACELNISVRNHKISDVTSSFTSIQIAE